MKQHLFKRKGKIVYLPMAADIIHHGHIRLINKARRYGKVVIGLLIDEAIAKYKRVPVFTYEERKEVIESIKGVWIVIQQNDDDYVDVIKTLKPEYFIHGDDWKTGIQKEKRERVLEAMKELGGKVIEVGYTKGISTTQIIGNL